MSTSLQVDRSQNDSLNLQVLQRRDPKIVEILDTASHVVMYNFEPLKQEWCKSEVEGTMFIVKRCASPRFQLVVNNRLSRVNLALSFDAQVDLENVDQFVMLKFPQAEDQIYGIWFYPEEDRSRIYTLLKRYVNQVVHDIDPGITYSIRRVLTALRRVEAVPSVPASKPAPGAAAGAVILGMITNTNTSQVSDKKQIPTSSLLMPSSVSAKAAAKSQTKVLKKKSAEEKKIKQDPVVAPPVSALTKEQLKQTLVSLIEQDTDFVDQIYRAYVANAARSSS